MSATSRAIFASHLPANLVQPSLRSIKRRRFEWHLDPRGLRSERALFQVVPPQDPGWLAEYSGSGSGSLMGSGTVCASTTPASEWHQAEVSDKFTSEVAQWMMRTHAVYMVMVVESCSYRQRGAQNGQVIARLAVENRWIADSHHQFHQHTKAPYVSLRDNVAARSTVLLLR